jgi:prefoldin subunit 5
MVPNDINILTQAASEITRAKNLIASAEARMTSVLNSGNEKTYVEIDDLNAAIASVKAGIEIKRTDIPVSP